MSPCGEFGSPTEASGFAKIRQAWAGCGCAARSIGLNSMRARKARRRPKIAAVFFEPNSSTLPGTNHPTQVAGIARVRHNEEHANHSPPGMDACDKYGAGHYPATGDLAVDHYLCCPDRAIALDSGICLRGR